MRFFLLNFADLHKLDAWKTLIKQDLDGCEVMESDSESDSDSEGDDSDSDDDDSDEDDDSSEMDTD